MWVLFWAWFYFIQQKAKWQQCTTSHAKIEYEGIGETSKQQSIVNFLGSQQQQKVQQITKTQKKKKKKKKGHV